MEIPILSKQAEELPQHTLLLIPGQGTLRKDIYKLAEQVPEVQEAYEIADEVIRDVHGSDGIQGRNISEWAKYGTDEEFAQNTVVAQPLIVATSTGLAKYLLKIRNADTTYGHSIGELAALHAAGVLSQRNAIGLAALRGVYSEEADTEHNGMMAALLNVSQEVKAKLKFGEEEGVVISTDNTPHQFTISGYKEKVLSIVDQVKGSVDRVKGLSKEERRQLPNGVILKIGKGFHSFLMKPAQSSYEGAVNAVPFLIPTKMNYFSNHSHDYEADPDIIRSHQVEQLASPVLFWSDFNKLVGHRHIRIMETGPASVLSDQLKEQREKGNLPLDLEILSVERDLLKNAA